MTQTLRGKTTLLVLGAATVNSPRSPFPWCSKLCSDRVGNRQIGTRQDKIAIGGFWLETGRTWRESRDANRALVGLANHRLQPLGHLTAARRLSIRQHSSCEHQKIVVIVPETMPASLEEPRSERRQFPFADLVGKGGGFFVRSLLRATLDFGALRHVARSCSSITHEWSWTPIELCQEIFGTH
jgi:hypothetical protein